MTYTQVAATDEGPPPRVSLPRAMVRFVSGAFHLRGRASRSEYWWWMLVNVVVLAVTLFLIPSLFSGEAARQTLPVGPFGSWLFAEIELFSTSSAQVPSAPFAAFSLLFAGLWRFVTVIPGFTVAVRRLHDSNLSGWWALLALIPPGPFVLLLLAARRSRPEGVRFDG